MHSRFLHCSALASVVASLGCTLSDGEPVDIPLNSDMILARYGSYRVDVVYQDDTRRLSALLSDAADGAVARTLALVEFERPVPSALIEADREIRAGGSIGSTLRNHGFDVVKTHCHVGSIELDAAHPAYRHLRLDRRQTAAVHSYDLLARDAAGARRYAHIIELHHPDYLSERDVTALYGAVNDPRCVDGFGDTLGELLINDAA